MIGYKFAFQFLFLMVVVINDNINFDIHCCNEHLFHLVFCMLVDFSWINKNFFLNFVEMLSQKMRD